MISDPKQKAILKEIKRRVQAVQEAATRPKFDLNTYFFPKQIEFFSIPPPDIDGKKIRFKTAVCSRRAGKTKGIIGDAINLCLTEKKVRVLYITLTRENCVEIIWPDLIATIEEFQIPVKINQQRLSITFLETGSVFSCAGAKDKREIGKFRGRKLRRIYIDEAQNFPAYIQDMIEADLMPTLRDLRGEMFVTGTPGPLKRGFFYTIATNGRWDSHNWTAWDNPHMHNPAAGLNYDQTLEEEREVRGINVNDPTYIRETYGQWTEDKNSLVFKFDATKNVTTQIPNDLTYIFGIDLGYNDADAIAVLGYSNSTGKVYLVEEVVERKQGITELVSQIERLQAKYSPVRMVMDSGGLGKKIQEEIKKRHTIPVEAADKNRKFEYIELLNDDLRTGKFQAFPNSLFEEDCYLVQWDRDVEDPTKIKVSKAYHSDACFVSGTMVNTISGPKPIETITVGELIETRQGYFPAKWSAKTGTNKSVVKLTFTDGKSITCTPNHPIYTENRGFIAAENLTQDDRCVSIQLWGKTKNQAYTEKQLSSTAVSFIDTQAPSTNTCKIISPAITKVKKLCSIGLFGNFILDKFQRGTSFITRTITTPIMILETLSASHLKNTLGTIGPMLLPVQSAEDCLTQGKLLKSGTQATRGVHGTGSMLSLGARKIEKRLLELVQFVKASTCAILSPRATEISARLSVFLKTEGTLGWTMKTASVFFAVNNTPATSTVNKNSVVGLVTRETLTRKEDVYNLSVSECPEYYANGILVHNCDAVLYGWRECNHYFKHAAAPKLPKNSSAFMDALEAKEAEEMELRKAGHDLNWGVDDVDLAGAFGESDDF